MNFVGIHPETSPESSKEGKPSWRWPCRPPRSDRDVGQLILTPYRFRVESKGKAGGPDAGLLELSSSISRFMQASKQADAVLLIQSFNQH